MTARVSRSFIKGAKAKGMTIVESKKQLPRGSAGWSNLHLDTSHGAGRFPRAAKADRTRDGHVFDSKAEASRYSHLKLLERVGEISDLELQPSWDVMIGSQKLCTFTADFSYVCKRRGPVIEDVKSTGTEKDPAYRLRKRAAQLAHGITVDEVIV